MSEGKAQFRKNLDYTPPPKTQNWAPIHNISKRKVYYFRGDLVSVLRRDKVNSTTTYWNWIKDRHETCLTRDFNRYKQTAYTSKHAEHILGYTYLYFLRMRKEGRFKAPTGRHPGGELKPRSVSYYSEQDLYDIRDALANHYVGAPRKDGLPPIPSQKTLTEPELRARIQLFNGERDFVYIYDAEGNQVPIFNVFPDVD